MKENIINEKFLKILLINEGGNLKNNSYIFKENVIASDFVKAATHNIEYDQKPWWNLNFKIYYYIPNVFYIAS